MNRRHFLMSSAAVATAAPGLMSSPNDTIRVGCVGIRGRGVEHIKSYSKMANVEIAALCDIDENSAEQAPAGDMRRLARSARRVHRSSQAAGRQIDRRYFDRHAEPPSHAADHLGMPGRQRRLCREAVLAQMFEAKQIVAAAQQIRPHRAARSQEPLLAGIAGGGAEDARRPDRRCLHGSRPLLQVA